MLSCVTLWIGPRLGAVERACLRSVLGQGHRVELYCYRAPDGIPTGVELRDAAEILPEAAIFRDRRGSVTCFSDRFRFELQRRGRGTWVDTDVYLLAPLDEQRPYLFGEEAPGVINNAVLRLPPDSPMLPRLLEPFDGRTPNWLRLRPKVASLAREWLVGRASVEHMPWGTTGPAAMTAVARETGLAGNAEPSDVFYPVPWQQADWILRTDIGLGDVVTGRTVAVHLWNEMIRDFKDEAAPRGSFLERLQREGAA